MNKYILYRQAENFEPSTILNSNNITECVDAVKKLHPLESVRYKWDRKENLFSTEVKGFKYIIEKIYGKNN